MLIPLDLVTTPWAIPRFSEMNLEPQIQLSVIWPSRIVTQLAPAKRTSTVLLVLNHSKATLPEIQTTLLVIRRSPRTMTVCLTRPWELSLSRVILQALQTSRSATQRQMA